MKIIYDIRKRDDYDDFLKSHNVLASDVERALADFANECERAMVVFQDNARLCYDENETECDADDFFQFIVDRYENNNHHKILASGDIESAGGERVFVRLAEDGESAKRELDGVVACSTLKRHDVLDSDVERALADFANECERAMVIFQENTGSCSDENEAECDFDEFGQFIVEQYEKNDHHNILESVDIESTGCERFFMRFYEYGEGSKRELDGVAAWSIGKDKKECDSSDFHQFFKDFHRKGERVDARLYSGVMLKEHELMQIYGLAKDFRSVRNFPTLDYVLQLSKSFFGSIIPRVFKRKAVAICPDFSVGNRDGEKSVVSESNYKRFLLKGVIVEDAYGAAKPIFERDGVVLIKHPVDDLLGNSDLVSLGTVNDQDAFDRSGGCAVFLSVGKNSA